MLKTHFTNIKTFDEILVPISTDKSIAVGKTGSMKRLVIFGKELYNKKVVTLTGNIYKLVKKLPVEVLDSEGFIGLERLKESSLNVIWYDPNNFEPYEYRRLPSLEEELRGQCENKN